MHQTYEEINERSRQGRAEVVRGQRGPLRWWGSGGIEVPMAERGSIQGYDTTLIVAIGIPILDEEMARMYVWHKGESEPVD
jgi:hypothetical protein